MASKTLGDVVRVSNSELQAFKRCRRRWWLGYYRGLTPRQYRHTGPLALGSRVHYALERYYGYGDDLLAAHHAQVERDRYSIMADLGDTTELDAEAELGRIMLEGYQDWVLDEGLDAYLEVLGAEETLRLPLFSGAVELIGKLDIRFLRKTDGSKLFGDWKTSARFEDFTRFAHMDEQQLTYHVLEASQPEDKRTDGGMFRLLKKVKRTTRAVPPFYEQVEVRHNNFSLRSMWARLHGTIAELMRLRTALDEGSDPHQVAYPTPRRDCNFDCPFVQICPMFDDGSAAEAALELGFAEHDAYARYHEKTPGLELP